MTKNSSQSMVYLGTVDDVVFKYPWKNFPEKSNSFLETILEHILFGRPLLINDGYLVNHPEARKDLLLREKSLILTLIRKGFIKVLTRVEKAEDLVNMPEKMAKDIGSFEESLKKEDAVTFSYALNDVGESLRFNTNCYKWPKVDMGDGFRILTERAFLKISDENIKDLGFESDLSKVKNSLDHVINRLINNTSGARNYFENHQLELAKNMSSNEGLFFVKEMMGLANEIYHYNFGINLDHWFSPLGTNVMSETRYSNIFEDLLAIEASNFEVEENISLIKRPRIVTTLDPLVLAEIVDESTDIGKAKTLYLSRLNEFINKRSTVEEIKQFSDMYADKLAKHFSVSVSEGKVVKDKRRFVLKDKDRIKIGVNIIRDLSNIKHPGLGLISSYVVEPILQKPFIRFRKNRYKNEMLDVGDTQSKPVHKLSQKAMIGSLRFDSDVIAPVAKSIKELKS